MIRRLLLAWWEGLKELSQPGGYQRRYERIHAQMSSSPLPSRQQPVPQQQIPIDMEIQQVQLKIEQCKLQLREVSTNMANARSHYQQRHIHGGGKFGSLIRSSQRGSKDAKLRKQQPAKERLQREKLAQEQYLHQLKSIKAQGIRFITRKP